MCNCQRACRSAVIIRIVRLWCNPMVQHTHNNTNTHTHTHARTHTSRTELSVWTPQCWTGITFGDPEISWPGTECLLPWQGLHEKRARDKRRATGTDKTSVVEKNYISETQTKQCFCGVNKHTHTHTHTHTSRAKATCSVVLNSCVHPAH